MPATSGAWRPMRRARWPRSATTCCRTRTPPRAGTPCSTSRRRRPGAVALPLSPPHAISSWLSIVAAHGEEPFEDAGRRRARHGHPGGAGPARPAGGARLGAARRARADDRRPTRSPTSRSPTGTAPTPRRPRGHAGSRTSRPPRTGRRGAVLGGAGLAVSAASEHAGRGGGVRRMGQRRRGPARHRRPAPAGSRGTARRGTIPSSTRLAGGFYSGTRATIDGRWVRPARRLVARRCSSRRAACSRTAWPTAIRRDLTAAAPRSPRGGTAR